MIDKNKVIALVLISALAILLYLVNIPKDCGSDDSCFSKYQYEIVGKKNDNCIIEVTLISLSANQPADMKQALEGKSMKCAITRETLKSKTLNEIEDLNDNCTGQLKEALLQITIDNMYKIIIKNLGSIAADLNETTYINTIQD